MLECVHKLFSNVMCLLSVWGRWCKVSLLLLFVKKTKQTLSGSARTRTRSFWAAKSKQWSKDHTRVLQLYWFEIQDKIMTKNQNNHVPITHKKNPFDVLCYCEMLLWNVSPLSRRCCFQQDYGKTTGPDFHEREGCRMFKSKHIIICLILPCYFFFYYNCYSQDLGFQYVN